MQLKGIRLAFALTVASVLSAAASTQAASVSYNSATFSGMSPYTVPLAIQKFDTSLGTLTGVSITVSSKTTANIVVINYGATNQVFTDATASIPVTVSTLVGSSTSSSLTATSTLASGIALAAPGQPGGFNVFTGVAGSWVTSSPAAVIAPGDFANYSGVGFGTVNVSVSSGVGTFSGSGSSVAFGGSAVVDSYVTVTYEYTPVLVPEPTSSAMFGIGIVLAVGLGWGRRRRQLSNLAA